MESQQQPNNNTQPPAQSDNNDVPAMADQQQNNNTAQAPAQLIINDVPTRLEQMFQAVSRQLADPLSVFHSFSYAVSDPTTGDTTAIRTFTFDPTRSFAGAQDEILKQTWEQELRGVSRDERGQLVRILAVARDVVDEEERRVEVPRAAQVPASGEGSGAAQADAHDGALGITRNLENNHRNGPQAANTSASNTAKKTDRAREKSHQDVPKGEAEEHKTDDRELGEAIGVDGTSGSSVTSQNRLNRSREDPIQLAQPTASGPPPEQDHELATNQGMTDIRDDDKAEDKADDDDDITDDVGRRRQYYHKDFDKTNDEDNGDDKKASKVTGSGEASASPKAHRTPDRDSGKEPGKGKGKGPAPPIEHASSSDSNGSDNNDTNDQDTRSGNKACVNTASGNTKSGDTVFGNTVSDNAASANAASEQPATAQATTSQATTSQATTSQATAAQATTAQATTTQPAAAPHVGRRNPSRSVNDPTQQRSEQSNASERSNETPYVDSRTGRPVLGFVDPGRDPKPKYPPPDDPPKGTTTKRAKQEPATNPQDAVDNLGNSNAAIPARKPSVKGGKKGSKASRGGRKASTASNADANTITHDVEMANNPPTTTHEQGQQAMYAAKKVHMEQLVAISRRGEPLGTDVEMASKSPKKFRLS
jgi:hypothetical protein